MMFETPLSEMQREDAEQRRREQFKSKVDLAKLLKGEIDED
jgi:hypothetical protein